MADEEIKDEVKEEPKEEVKEEPKEESKEPDRFDQLAEQVKSLTDSFTNFQSTIQTPAPEVKKEDVSNEDQFWSDPMGQINKIFDTKLQGVADTLFESQKENVRNKYSDFSKYEKEIDELIKQAPQFKNQTGVVDKLYKMVKGLYSDDLEAELRQKIQDEHDDKVGSSLEGGSPPADAPKSKTNLTEEQKVIAHKMMPDLDREKAEEEYAKWI
jgi:hypothetical protein